MKKHRHTFELIGEVVTIYHEACGGRLEHWIDFQALGAGQFRVARGLPIPSGVFVQPGAAMKITITIEAKFKSPTIPAHS